MLLQAQLQLQVGLFRVCDDLASFVNAYHVRIYTTTPLQMELRKISIHHQWCCITWCTFKKDHMIMCEHVLGLVYMHKQY